jgi:hypothetical protein
VRKRIRRRKAKSKSISLSGPSTSREPLIGKPLLLDGEDAAAYERFSALINATVQPIDTIERVFVDDIVSLEWEVLRWRRLKCGFIQTLGLKALKERLVRDLDYAQYSEYYVEDLAEILEENLSESDVESAEAMAKEYAQNKPNAVDRVDKILSGIGTDTQQVANQAQARKAEELVQEYGRREPATITLVDEILAGAGTSMDALIVQAMIEQMEMVERFDRLTAIAETRRNASLHEIERRRALFGEAIRRSTKEIEDAEFEEISDTHVNKRKRAA